MKQFKDIKAKDDFLNKLIEENSKILADDAMNILDFPPIHYNKIIYTSEYYEHLVQFYAGILTVQSEKLNIVDKYANVLNEYDLNIFDQHAYLTRLKTQAAIIMVNKIYYNK